MSFLFVVALLGVGYYLLWRRGRGPEQPTIWMDIKSLFRFKPKERSLRADHEPQSTAQHPPKFFDSSELETDHELTDVDRLEEIMELNDLWGKSSEAETKRREEL